MRFEKQSKQFFIVTSRFDWGNNLTKGLSSRILSGLCFLNVEKVHKRNFPRLQSKDILNFLTLDRKKDHINLLFSGDIELKLFGNKIFLRLDDLDKAWPTIFIPNHNE